MDRITENEIKLIKQLWKTGNIGKPISFSGLTEIKIDEMSIYFNHIVKETDTVLFMLDLQNNDVIPTGRLSNKKFEVNIDKIDKMNTLHIILQPKNELITMK